MSTTKSTNADTEPADAATQLWRQGNRTAALEAAFTAAETAMRAVARRIAGDEAADIVQDALLRVWNHPERFDADRGVLASYLVVTARGTALDHVRQTQRRREREQRATSLLELFAPWEPTDAAIIEQLRIALARLQLDEQTLISNAFFEGHSYNQTAIHLGLPEGTVKSRMRRTLQRLRDDLNDDREPSTAHTR